MPINPVWPKPYKWLVDPRLVHPGQRWVWHTKPRFIMPLWEDVRPGTAQRYRRLRYGRGSQHDWRLNTSASTIRTRFGPAISIRRLTALSSRVRTSSPSHAVGMRATASRS